MAHALDVKGIPYAYLAFDGEQHGFRSRTRPFGHFGLVLLSTFGGGNPWGGPARAVWGAGWVAVFLAIANSAIANSNAGATATTRMW